MKLHIEQLQFDCIIGLLKKEREIPQKICVDTTIDVDTEEMSIDYARVARLIETTYKTERFFTVEESLVHITQSLKENFPSIKKIHIKVVKPQIIANCRVGASYSKKY